LETAAKAKMLDFVLPTEKGLVVYGHFYKFLVNHSELKKKTNICVDAGLIFLKQN